jgi:hypothetical protein
LQYSSSFESLSHSSAHALQMTEHEWQSSDENSPPTLINIALALHTMAHSRVSAMQRDNISMLFSLRHSVAQCSHSEAH